MDNAELTKVLDMANEQVTVLLDHPLGKRITKGLTFLYEDHNATKHALIDTLNAKHDPDVAKALVEFEIQSRRIQQEQALFMAQAYKDAISGVFKVARPSLGKVIRLVVKNWIKALSI